MINIDIQNSTFNDNSSVVRNNYETPTEVDYRQIEKDLIKSKKSQKKESEEYKAVETLEKHTKNRNWPSLCSALADLSTQFTASTLAGIAGNYLCELVGIK